MRRPASILRTVLQPLAIAIALAVLVRSVARVYAIPSSSMMPTLAEGDRILATRYFAGGPARGDVVVFEAPDASGELLVKRVVGMPGDLIDSRLGRLRVGGHTVPEPYLLRQAETGAIESQLVPPGSYFVMGDNRGDSIDSRVRGAVPASAIIGRARMVLWSAGERDLTGESSGGRPGRRLFKCIE